MPTIDIAPSHTHRRPSMGRATEEFEDIAATASVFTEAPVAA